MRLAEAEFAGSGFNDGSRRGNEAEMAISVQNFRLLTNGGQSGIDVLCIAIVFFIKLIHKEDAP